MTVRRIKGRGLLFKDVPLAHYRLLQQIPAHADPAGCRAADERLYQDAAHEPDDPEADDINADWREYTLPDFREDFARQLDTVQADLATATEKPGNSEGPFHDVLVPLDHVDAWYGALNQARLVMQERYRFPEQETPEALFALLESEHIGPYFTARLYSEIQGVLLELGMDAGWGDDADDEEGEENEDENENEKADEDDDDVPF